MPAQLEIKDLRTHFFTREGVVKAVDGVSYYLNQGETLGLVGESGCGKSVSALSIMRLIPDPPGRIVGGSIMFENKDLTAMPEKELRKIRGNAISMIFQDPMTSLNPVLRIGEQMTESIELHLKLDRKAAVERAVELVDAVGIPDGRRRLRDYPHQFSGGMRQRIMIAMALSCNPRLLIADEPTTALDVTIQAQILDLLRRLQAKIGMSILLITHDLGVVAGTAKRVAVMYAGKIVEQAPTKELFAHPRHPYTLALLHSIPRLDGRAHTRLSSIPGAPPDLVDPEPGCRFAQRCTRVTEECRQQEPPLVPLGREDHLVACYRPIVREEHANV
ncbi:MAG: ABC transporter ATP-binding protein [Actinobacteria bacterium]|nr:ABC transporter ATP-binding protein [Actinomycetota bacterium]